MEKTLSTQHFIDCSKKLKTQGKVFYNKDNPDVYETVYWWYDIELGTIEVSEVLETTVSTGQTVDITDDVSDWKKISYRNDEFEDVVYYASRLLSLYGTNRKFELIELHKKIHQERD
jgi:hypothetical protein